MNKKLVFREESLEKLKQSLIKKQHQKRSIFNFLNSHSVYLFKHHKNFRKKLLNENNINYPDGFIVSLILSIKNLEKISRLKGADFAKDFLNDKEAMKDSKHLFLGESNDELERLRENIPLLNKNNSFLYVIPYLKKEKFDDTELIKLINKIKPDYIWNKIGNPKQEILANDIMQKTDAKVIFNIGAGLDYLIGKKKRAPKILQKIGLEWLYRLITDFNHSKIKVWRSLIGSFYSLYSIELKN